MKIQKNCIQCQKSFSAMPSEIKRGGGKFCSFFCYTQSRLGHFVSTETRNKIAKTKMGESNSSKRPEVREKIRQSLLGRDNGGYKKTCMTCGKLFKDFPSNSTVNCSKECTSKYLSLTRSGEKSPTWKGGITPKVMKIRNSIEMQLWRQAVFARDGFMCQMCQQVGGKLQADHIKPFAIFPELRMAIDNGQTLCVSCHRIKTKKDLPIIRSMQTILRK